MKINCKLRIVWLVVLSFACPMLANMPCWAGEVTIFIPRSTAVRAYQPDQSDQSDQSGEMTQAAIERKDLVYANIIEANRWNAVIKSSSSRQYNSHGYAWQVYSGGAAVMIEDKDVAYFWRDGSYLQIRRHEAVRGDIVVMTDPRKPDQSHSAVVINARWCMSKWADGPLVLHKLNDHPFGKTYRYYRKAKVASPSGLTIISSR